MPVAGYHYEVDKPKDLPALIRAFERAISAGTGSPLRPVSSVGGVIDIASYKEAVAGDANGIAAAEVRAKTTKQAIDEQRMYALMVAREPRDLPPKKIPRTTRMARGKAGGPYDWHLLETRTVQAWKMFADTGRAISWDAIRVGQIDTGYTEHACLGFDGTSSGWVNTIDDYNYVAEHGLGVGDSSGNFPFNEFPEIAIDPLSGLNGGHGTRTNSILSGYDDTVGYRGSAPKIPVVPIRLIDSVWLDGVLGTDLPAAIYRLVDRASVRLITLSLGSPHPYPILSPIHLPAPRELRQAIDHAYERGVFFFSAAGNNIPNPAVVYPARLNRTIAVAGTGPDAERWLGSSRGPEVEISAPGYRIHRADKARDGSDEYGVGEGTSFATPQVCGAAALWLAWHGSAITAAYPLPWQPIEAFRSLLASTASPLAGNPADWKGKWGAGLLNVEALLRAPLPPAASLSKSDPA